MTIAIVAGWLCDRLLGDPRRFHPVAGFGRVAAALERVLWRPTRAVGAVYAGALVALVAGAVAAVDGLLKKRAAARSVFRALVVWSTLGGRSLERAALTMSAHLEAGELDCARALAPTLVGRDPSVLDGGDLVRATVESVAENTSDAVVAPLLWAALLGAPGAAGYRAANTLDAMVGHPSERYQRFGWAAARLDDLVNWPAARLGAVLAIVATPIMGGDPMHARRAAFGDGVAHPSPNAGRIEGAFAGALGVRLGGVTRYQHGVEQRPELGRGAPPTVEDIARAVTLARLVGAAATALSAALAWRIAR